MNLIETEKDYLLLALVLENARLQRRVRQLEGDPSAVGPGKLRKRLPRACDTEADMLLRQRLKQVMEQRHLTRTDLARTVGVSHSSVCDVLCGQKQLPPSWLRTLESRLGIPRNELLEGLDWRPRRSGRPRLAPEQRRRRGPRGSCASGELAVRDRLRALIVQRGFRVPDLAAHLHVSQQSVYRALSGKMQVPPAWLRPLASLLGLTSEELLAGLDWTPRRGGRPSVEQVSTLVMR